MKYWKRVALDGFEQLKPKLLSYVFESVDVERCQFWNQLDVQALPELQSMIQRTLDVQILAVAALVLRQRTSNLHIDHTRGQFGHKARLNLPLLNCEKSQTVFYDVGDTPHWKVSQGDGTKVWRWGSYPRLTSFTLTDPTVIRVSAVHGLHSFTTEPRIALTLNLEKDAVTLLEDTAQ